MLAAKTVILPIHNLSFLDRSDYIVCLDDSRIVEQGTYSELLSNGKKFTSLIEEFAAKQDPADETEAASDRRITDASPDSPPVSPLASDSRTSSDSSEEGSPIKTDGKMMETEERQRGGVKADVYRYYLRLAGWTM